MVINYDVIYEGVKYTRNMASGNSKFGFDLDMTTFLKMLYCCIKPQSYGSRIQNRLISEYNLEKVKSSLDKGDVKSINGNYGEIKVSYKGDKDVFNFVQIRPHQNCDFYLLFTIDPDDDYKTYTFIISKVDMNFLLDKVKAGNCHGVSKNKKDRSMEELRFSVKFKSENWNYMIDNFLIEDVGSYLNGI